MTDFQFAALAVGAVAFLGGCLWIITKGRDE